MALAERLPRLAEGEYLQLERGSSIKSEFWGGEMFAMAGGTLRHSLISTNLAGEFRNRLKGRPCTPYNSDLRIKVAATGLFTYPDLSVLCGTPEFVPQTDDTVLNPSVLVEVLSDPTEAYDRGKKFELYRQIETLQEYLLVSQKEPRIEQFIRQPDGRWLLVDAAGLDAVLEVPSLHIALSLAEVFAKVDFRPAALRGGPVAAV